MGDLSKYFDRHEFACSCGCGFDTVDHELIILLEAIREQFDRPITINSGCRCPDHNAAVGGSENSQHLYGRAADIVVKDTPAVIVAEAAKMLDAPGLGEYENFTHVDSRVGFARWDG